MTIDPDKLPLPMEPYRGILPFRLLDWRIFLERDIETERLGNLVAMYSGVLLYGQSGAGKSSLLNAGFLPEALRRGRSPERIRVFPEHGREILVERIRLREENEPAVTGMPAYLPSRFTPADTDDRIALSCEEFLKRLHASSELGPPLLIFDQFEELVTLFEQNPRNRELFESAQRARMAIEKLVCELLLNERFAVKVVFAFRDDYLARLTPLFSRIPNLMDQRVLLMPPRVDVVQHIVRGPFVPSNDGERGLPNHFEDPLSDDLAEKIRVGIGGRTLSAIVNLTELQTVCQALWRQPKLREDLSGAGDPAAVLQKILESEALSVLKRLLPWDQLRAVALLSNLVTKDGTRDVVSEENLLNETRRIPLIWIFRRDLKKLLEKMPRETGLLRCSLSSGTTYYELTSESLIPWIQRHQQQFRELARAIWGYGFVALVLVLFLVGYVAYRAGSAVRNVRQELEETEKAWTAAKQEKTSAEAITKHATTVLAEVKQQNLGLLTSKTKADQESASARAARKRAEEERAEIERAAINVNTAFEKVQLANRKADEARRRAEQNERLAKEARDKAIEARKSADDLIEYLNFDLRDRLNPLDPAWNSVNQRILDYHDHYAPADDDFEGRRRKAAALGDRGNILLCAGQFAEATEYFRNALVIVDRLFQNVPEHLRLRSNRATYTANLSAALLGKGEFESAREAAEKSVQVAKELVAVDPTNSKWQDDLSFSYSRLGSVRNAQGDLADALKSYHASLDIQEKLKQQQHNNTGWQLKAHRDSLAIAEKLAKEEPRDADWQAELAYCYWRTGTVWAKAEPKSKNEARTMIKKARSTLRTLERRVSLTAEQQKWLDAIEAALREMN